jgi:hypothetical protein
MFLIFLVFTLIPWWGWVIMLALILFAYAA